MQQALPITIVADVKFSNSLAPLVKNLEMWINFQALKANWYGSEARILSFDFTLVRTLEEKTQNMNTENWVIESGYAYHYESSNLTTIAFIAVADLVRGEVAIEQAIKVRLTNVTNAIVQLHDFQPLS